MEAAATTKQASKPRRLSRARQTAILKALADPRRYELLERIAHSTAPLGCSEALTALKIAPATLSHHIKELEAAGLIRAKREGKFVFLSLCPEVWAALLATLETLKPECGARY